jgi:dsRNA-specific ribonuclease
VPIALISPKHPNFGPQQHKMYAALTTTSANDSLNMERLETLGDSYLKLTTSLYLYTKFELSEGKLTEVKIFTIHDDLYCFIAQSIKK